MSTPDPTITTHATVTFTVHVRVSSVWDPRESMLRPLREAKEHATRTVRDMVHKADTSIRFGKLGSVTISVEEDQRS